MNTLITKIKHLGFLVFFLYALSIPVFAETDADATAQHAQKNINISGLYLGFYPCDDCQGIRTTLALNKNDTYVYITQYIGKSDREFVEKGKFTIGDNGDKIILTPRKGSTTEQQFLIDDDVLIKLDEDGNRITKDNADRYILKRKDVVSAKGNHSGH